jgi:hypothetical protein
VPLFRKQRFLIGYVIICSRGFDIYGEITLSCSEKARAENYTFRRAPLGYDYGKLTTVTSIDI